MGLGSRSPSSSGRRAAVAGATCPACLVVDEPATWQLSEARRIVVRAWLPRYSMQAAGTCCPMAVRPGVECVLPLATAGR